MPEEKPERAPRGPRERRQPARPVGAVEHYVGIGVLSLVMLICTWVLIRGLAPKGVLWGAYDPSLFGGQVAAPPATPAEQPAEAAESYDGATDGAAAASSGAKPAAQVLPVAAEGWTAGAVESFGPDTLYEKIDGRAEAYLAYGAQRLECLTATAGSEAADVFVYDLGSPLQAFGMFTSERSGGDPLPGVGQLGYQAGGSLFFWRDRYYVQVLPGGAGEHGEMTDESGASAASAAVLKLARAVDAKLPQSTFEVPGRAWFPAEGMKADSLGYVVKQALGQEWLGDVYTARYDAGGKELEVFLARRSNAGEAAELLTRYTEFLKSAGKLSTQTVDGVELTVADQSGMYDVVFQRGPVFGGVTYTDQRDAAVKLAARLAKTAGKE